MRRLLCLCLLACTSPAVAQEKNVLTPKDAAEGWLQLFDGDSDFGWKGGAKAMGGVLEVKGQAEHGGRFPDFELIFEFKVTGAPKATFAIVHDNGLDNKKHDLPTARTWNGVRITEQSSSAAQLLWNVPDGATLQLRNVKLKPLGLKSIFNGKDLDGWKPFPGKKSTFAVIDGAINVKNGPGDLQTDAKYADFLLQLECISNGKHLNSGVFFRCKPNEYTNGYEAQVHNQFTAEPTKEYVLEEYDPKTNMLTAKKKVKYTATDFGTGAIYRRIPARKEVAKDGAWFTMTILAHKNHLLTWVNGVHVTDWTDHRPMNDNPRNGCRLEAGHISLQGHDPTTDLSFRNFRIGEMK